MSDLYVPESLKYGATYSSSKISRMKILPTTGSGPYGPNSIIRFALPSRSILRLASVSVVADLTISGLVQHATDFVNAQLPYTQKLISRANWICNSISCNPSNNYDMVAVQLAKLTASEDWCKTRCSQGALDLIQHTDDSSIAGNRPLNANPVDANGSTSKVSQIVIDDFLGLCRGNGGNGGVLDCGIFGNVELELTLNSNNCLKVMAGGTATVAAVTYSLANISLQIDAISSVSNDYLQMMSLRLKDSRPINYAFQNFNCQIQSHGGTGVIRHSCNTNCLDIVISSPLGSGYNTLSSQALTKVNPPRYTFDSGRTHANQSATQISFNIGSTQYPQGYQLSAFEALDVSQNTFGIQDRYANNLLCSGTADASVTTSSGRQFFLSDNAIFAMALSNESEGWASKDRILSGVSTNQSNSEVVFQFTNFGSASGFLCSTLLYTSVLQYDPASATVQLIQ